MTGRTRETDRTTAPTGEIPRFERSVTVLDVVRQEGSDELRFDVSFSSEEPVDTFFGREILDHKRGSVRMEFMKSGSAPVLNQHDHADQIGVIESARISDRRGVATIRLSKSERGREIARDIEDGVRSNISVGYRIHKARVEEVDEDTGYETYRAVDWEPYEVSLVSVPADKTVGVGRADSVRGYLQTIIEKEDDEMDGMNRVRDGENVPAAPTNPTTEPRPAVNEDAIRTEAREAERARAAEIRNIGKAHDLVDEAEKAIDEGMTSNRFREVALDKLGERSQSTTTEEATEADEVNDPRIGLTQREIKRFSILRAIRAGQGFADDSDRFRKEAGFELECSRAVEQKMGKRPKGIYIPDDVLMDGHYHNADAVRDFMAGNPSTGGNVIETTLMTGSFIDILRNKNVLMMAGATVLPGLVGDVAIPKQTAAGNAYWVSEGEAVRKTQPEFGQISLAPRTLGAQSVYTRQFLLQSSIGIESFIRNELTTAISLKISEAAFYGKGADGEPRGIINTPSVNKPTSFAAANPTYAEIVAMETAIESADADIGSMAFITDATVRGGMRTTKLDAGSGLFLINPGDGRVLLDYPLHISNQITDGDVFLGVWSQMIIGMWGGLDVLTDPYTNAAEGSVRIVAHQTMDVQVRQPAAFVYNNDS